MIEGIKLDISTDELRAHLTARSEHHAARREHYLAEYKRKTQSVISAEELMDSDEGFASTSNSIRSDDMGYAKHHRAKASFFKFVAQYLIPSETYRLSESDLAKFELAAGMF